jgi:hypothetical protein
MRKIQVSAVFWTLLLAIPFTALALSMAAYVTEHMSEILAWIGSVSVASTVGGVGWAIQFSERWPELAGMVVGQLIILTILIFARQSGLAENNTRNEN